RCSNWSGQHAEEILLRCTPVVGNDVLCGGSLAESQPCGASAVVIDQCVHGALQAIVGIRRKVAHPYAEIHARRLVVGLTELHVSKAIHAVSRPEYDFEIEVRI